MPKLRRVVTGEPPTPVGWMYFCPGCKSGHLINVDVPRSDNGAKWTFDGNMEAPTFAPSVLSFHYSKYTDEGKPAEGATQITDCHCFVTGGKIQFLGDCRHALAGQTVDLPDVPEHWL